MIAGTPSRMRHPDLHAVLSRSPVPAATRDDRPRSLRCHARLLTSFARGVTHD